MSRVLARKMFKKKAPKRSAKGVGITSMLEDEVAGYAEGGEVSNDDRAKRERMAQDLLDLGRAEFQMFAEGERPQMTRPPATMGVVPQPNPQAAQAAQMQQMAQMGMLPRFQEGGMVEAPSAWSRLRQGIGSAIGMRGRQPMFARNTNPEVYGSPIGSEAGSPAMDNPDFRYRAPAMPIANAAYTDPMGGYTGGTEPPPATPDQGLNIPVPSPVRAALGLPVFPEPEEKPYKPSAESGSPAGDTGGIMGGRVRREEPKKKEAPPLPPSERKSSDLSEIKQEREAKAATARQENAWLALMQAGLAIAGGRSPNAITNIGQGGQAGLASFMALEQQRRRDEDAAMRRDIAEREFRLQERRFQAQEPLLAAQAEYYRNRPAMDAARLQAQQQVARQRAVDAAQKAWENRTKSGPFAIEFMKMNDVQKKAAEELYLRQEFNRRYNEELSAFRAGVYGGGQRETGPSAEE